MAARRATFAGSWYSSDSRQLAEELAGWLSEAQATCGAARAIIAPHAGYSYSGLTAAWAYKHVDRSGIRRVFLLGPSHHVYLTRCALTTCSEYSTPLGPVPIDKQACDALRQTGLFDDMARKTDEGEHSLEMHLPFLLSVMHGQRFELVPVLVGALSEANEAVYGGLFAEHLVGIPNPNPTPHPHPHPHPNPDQVRMLNKMLVMTWEAWRAQVEA